MDKFEDVEKTGVARAEVNETSEGDSSILYGKTFWGKLRTWGVELRGIVPVPVEERIDGHFINILSLFSTMSLNILAIITGMTGTLSYGLSLTAASLTILFFTLLSCIIPAYFCTVGPKTGMRQMIQSRFSFGLYGVTIPALLNVATVTGFCVIGAVVGGQTLAAVSDGNLSIKVGIVITALVSLVVSFSGYKILHHYERWAGLPVLLALLVAVGCGGKHLSQQSDVAPAEATTVISFGALLAGYFIPYAGLSSDFSTYMRPDAPTSRIFWYAFFGLSLPSIPLMILGAAIGGAIPNVPAWNTAYETLSAGGVFGAMLASAGGFGKFMLVLLAFSVIGNIAGSVYSISLNFQIVIPALVKVPRAVFAAVTIAVVIPVAIKAAESFFVSLENFIGIVSYWSASYCAVVLLEFLYFRRGDPLSYDHSIWNKASELPTGIAALGAGICSFGLVIPSMAQIWYTGPIAMKTGDIGFEMAFCLTAVLYVVFRSVEIRIRGRV